ncbi:chemotaxis-specific protein-glutamate methyltransferase CheB [Haliovirga abyssi]|uniref:Protein-glutamate methylesterase/protein-glutamine glutaminase n=1 Tax=Haliovirga abyssi TaxID=2996794 RepID=A0AAU9DVP7_9FUSO|nr:chemotaxis-specific protein-glutamate methyltransferase CheB [Haliovirga abyssi]BDU50296.1 chemotaxis response regulator protein-glutamate methylesterase [Haliovirga abyssi]
MINAMVVDDSSFMRRAIKKILEKSGKIKVIEMANNGKDAFDKLMNNDEIDVITMDVEMPIMDGLEATKLIMDNKPRPIIILSSVTQYGTESAIKALEYGAVDIIVKSGNLSLDMNKLSNEIVDKVISVSGVTIKNNMRNLLIKNKILEKSIKKYDSEFIYSKNIRYKKLERMEKNPKVLFIGASTGGPKVLKKLIMGLPKLNLPIIITQHMPKGFTESLAKTLNSVSAMDVKEIAIGEELKSGIVYVVPGGTEHTILEKKDGKLIFNLKSNNEENKFYIPSVDVMLKSLVDIFNGRVFVIILTGMGNDGLDGVKYLRKYKNGYVIVESEETAIIYGMPRVIAEENLENEILENDKIADRVIKLLKTV